MRGVDEVLQVCVAALLQGISPVKSNQQGKVAGFRKRVLLPQAGQQGLPTARSSPGHLGAKDKPGKSHYHGGQDKDHLLTVARRLPVRGSPDHGRVFTSFLYVYLPDWRDRDRELRSRSRAGTGG